MNINFTVISPKGKLLMECFNTPAPQKGDMVLVGKHPYKAVRWICDYEGDPLKVAVMSVRDLDYDPYTDDEIRRRIENGETFYAKGVYETLSRSVKKPDGNVILLRYFYADNSVSHWKDKKVDDVITFFKQYGGVFTDDTLIDTHLQEVSLDSYLKHESDEL